jgi:superfamily I DNA and/or RNA helicase
MSNSPGLLVRHEHLYEKIEQRVVVSSDFPNDLVGAQRLFLDAKVILCTMSMMTHPSIPMFSKLISVSNVIVDEASQIYLGDYIPLLDRFGNGIQRLIFIGDDKQRE